MEIRIVIADDHDVVRRGLRAILDGVNGYHVVGEAANGRDAVALAIRLRPDLVCMDVSMPELNGFEATRRIRAAVPSTQVLVLTIHESEQTLAEVLRAGAQGYVVKSDAARTLIEAVASVAGGRQGHFFSPAVMLRAIQSGACGRVDHLPGGPILSDTPITSREREVAQLVAEGRRSREIANVLAISVKTVESHRASLLRKLNLRNASELIRWAIRNGIAAP